MTDNRASPPLNTTRSVRYHFLSSGLTHVSTLGDPTMLKTLLAAAVPLFAVLATAHFASAAADTKGGPLQFTVKDIDGKDVDLSQYKGKVVMIVNVASKCGLTPQYAALEKLYKDKKDKGFVILGFPANEFGSQEPGAESEIKTFCEMNFGVKFPLFSKIDVNGLQAHPLYKFLVKAKPGILGTEAIENDLKTALAAQ